MNKLPNKKDIRWKWSGDAVHEWEKICEESNHEYRKEHPYWKEVPFASMHFKMIWAKCLSKYCK